MNSGNIKLECDLQLNKIRDAEERLKELRSICKHENTFEGNWSYRVGSITPAVICSDCKDLIRIKN